ncbi:MAG TPA: glutathione S-transferase family protein [Geminicoccaceae bacterium]|nr:glutathione S-transferase family protein [Geminicoccaceae bacterium]
MAIVMYDLVGRDDRRFSPHCWRTRMALAHKGLDHETLPTRFTEIPKIEDGQVKTVPAMRDGERLIVDSWAIAHYLEQTYPERPSLFDGAGGEQVTRFVQGWCVAVLQSGLVGLIVADIWQHLMPEDQDYFRATREKRFGRTLEEVQSGREARVEEFRTTLQPLRMTLKDAPFLGGAQPLYADYLVFGAFQWARTISPFRILAGDDPLAAWLARCLDLYGGIGRRAPGYD